MQLIFATLDGFAVVLLSRFEALAVEFDLLFHLNRRSQIKIPMQHLSIQLFVDLAKLDASHADFRNSIKFRLLLFRASR